MRGDNCLTVLAMQPLSKGESPQITVRMPDELVDRLDRKCLSDGLSRSAFLRKILTAELDRAEGNDAA